MHSFFLQCVSIFLWLQWKFCALGGLVLKNTLFSRRGALPVFRKSLDKKRGRFEFYGAAGERLGSKVFRERPIRITTHWTMREASKLIGREERNSRNTIVIFRGTNFFPLCSWNSLHGFAPRRRKDANFCLQKRAIIFIIIYNITGIIITEILEIIRDIIYLLQVRL